MTDDVDRLEAALSAEDRDLLDGLAAGLARHRLVPAAMFFLESMQPLSFVGSQMMQFLRPLVAVIWTDPLRWDRVAALLERRGSIELLLRRLEARA